MGGHRSEHGEHVEHELGCDPLVLAEGQAAGMLGLVAAAWSQLSMDVAAAAAAASASPPGRTETGSMSVHFGSEAVSLRDDAAATC